MTSKIQVMLSVTVAMKCYLGHDSEKDREEGVTTEINKCAKCVTVARRDFQDTSYAQCDSGDEKLPWA
jgi:hypothetical protein